MLQFFDAIFQLFETPSSSKHRNFLRNPGNGMKQRRNAVKYILNIIRIGI